MRKNMIRLTGPQNIPAAGNKNFIENLQTAILLSLLDKGKLNEWQFELCREELRKGER